MKITGQTQTYHEECVIGSGANDTDLDPVLGVPLFVEKVITLRILRES